MSFEELPSKIFHPLLILPPSGALILILQNIGMMESLKWIGTWIVVSMLPTAYVAWNTGEKGFDVISRRQRDKSYLVGISSLIIALGLGIYFSAPGAVLDLGMYAIVAATVFGVFNRFTKISIHTGSLGFVAGGFLTIMHSIGIAGIIATIPVGWSRVKLGCHTRNQVIQGAILGLTSGVLAGLL